MLDRMACIDDVLTRRDPTMHLTFVMSTLMRRLATEYCFVKQILEGQEPSRDYIHNQLMESLNFLKGQSKGNA